jgi:hypothetical protein
MDKSTLRLWITTSKKQVKVKKDEKAKKECMFLYSGVFTFQNCTGKSKLA